MLNNRSSSYAAASSSVLFPWEELGIKSMSHLMPATCGLRYEDLRTRWHRFGEDQMLKPGVVWSEPPTNSSSLGAKPNTLISLPLSHNTAASLIISDRHRRAVEAIVSFTIHVMKELNPDPTAVSMMYGSNVAERGAASARHEGRGRGRGSGVVGGGQRGERVASTPLAGLTTTLLEDCDESFAVLFAEETIPWMGMLVARAPQLFEKGLPLLVAKDPLPSDRRDTADAGEGARIRGKDGCRDADDNRNDDDEGITDFLRDGFAESVILSEVEVATLLAMGFFSLFPFRTLARTPMPFVADSDLTSDKMGSLDFHNDEEGSKRKVRRTQPLEMPAFNFIHLHTINSPSSNAKLRCIMQYFKTMGDRDVGCREQKGEAEVEENEVSGKEADRLGIEILRYGVACGTKKNNSDAQGGMRTEETGSWIEKQFRATANNSTSATFSKATDGDGSSSYSASSSSTSTTSSASTEKKNKKTGAATPFSEKKKKVADADPCGKSPEKHNVTSRSLVKVDYRPSFPIEQCDGMIQADFANEWLGGGTLRYGCVQEEILFVIKPELITGMLLCERMREHEVVLISGARQFSEGSGYANEFRFASEYRPKKKNTCTGAEEKKKQNTPIVSVEIEDTHFSLARRDSGQYDAETADPRDPRGGTNVLYHSFVHNNNNVSSSGNWSSTTINRKTTKNKRTSTNLRSSSSSFKMVNNSVVAFDALNFHQYHPMQQYTTRAIDRELLKAFAAFDAPRYSVLSSSCPVSASSVQAVEPHPANEDDKHKRHCNEQYLLRPLATGGWGCGVFAGHHPLKFLIQWVAASLVGREMTFCAFGSELQLRPVRDLHEFLSGNRGSSLDLHLLYSRIIAFNSTPQGRAAASIPQAEHALVSRAFTDWMLLI